jgi:ElaB/YqjD/DUF883 family membrane-anchored ribosome-binding protein
MRELAEALRELHRRLAERMRRGEERERGVVISAQEFLPLLTSDARFAWLHALSELIVDLEVFLKADPSPTEDEAAAVRAEVERLISAPRFPETASAFTQRYCRYVAEDAQVAAAHASVKQLAERLPQAASVVAAQVLHERHRWAEARRHRRTRCR